MCDILATLRSDTPLFAKNSGRSPIEIQLLEYHRPETGLSRMDMVRLALEHYSIGNL